MTHKARNDGAHVDERIVSLRRFNNLQNVSSSYFRNEQLLEWISDETRIGTDLGNSCRAWPTERVSRTALSMKAAVAAAKSGVKSIPHWPEYMNGRDGNDLGESIDNESSRAVPCLDLAVAAGLGRELWDEECENWISLPPEMPNGNYVALRVFGESMHPLLHPGDIILVRLQTTCHLDSIVVARGTDGFVVKRLRRIVRGLLELEPINPDFPTVRVPAAEKPLLGVVVVRWCGHSPLA